MTVSFRIDRNRLAQLWQKLDGNPKANAIDYLRALPQAMPELGAIHTPLCHALSLAGGRGVYFWKNFFGGTTPRISYRILQDTYAFICTQLPLHPQETQELHTQMQRSFWHARPETLQKLWSQLPPDAPLRELLKTINQSTLLTVPLPDVKHVLYAALNMRRPSSRLFVRTHIIAPGTVDTMLRMYHLHDDTSPCTAALIARLKTAETWY